MDVVKLVIGEGLHVIKNDPVHDKNRKAEDKLTSNTAGEKAKVKQPYQYKLVGPKTKQQIGKQQVNRGNESRKKKAFFGKKRCCLVFGRLRFFNDGVRTGK